MRPPKQGLFSYAHHVFSRKGIYYYRADIPSDLKHIFHTSEIKQSLKTKDSKLAKVMAVSLEYKLQQTFCMIRSGMLSDDVVQNLVNELYPRRIVVKPKGKLLSSVMLDYITMHEANWTPKTKVEIQACNRLILDVLGDIEVRNITKQEVVDFRVKLLKLPANLYKKYSGKSIDEIMNITDIVPMSMKSVNKHISRLCALLSHSVKEGLVQVNYAQGMQLQVKQRSDEERKPYSKEDLRNIVNYLPRIEDRPERYWIPLIAMYSGMRLDEICQLYVEDVQKVDDVWCFNINDEKDKKVKTASGKRIIPVHPVLCHSGFLDYVKSQKKLEVPRLWMSLQWRASDGYSNAFGKWFQKFNRRYVTEDPLKVFHSFRHNVADTLKQLGIQEVLIAELLGHANESMTSGRYGKRYQPKVLLDVLNKLDYGIEPPMK